MPAVYERDNSCKCMWLFWHACSHGAAVCQRLAVFEPDKRPAMRLDNNISGVAFTRDGSTVCANYM